MNPAPAIGSVGLRLGWFTPQPLGSIAASHQRLEEPEDLRRPRATEIPGQHREGPQDWATYASLDRRRLEQVAEKVFGPYGA